ncbi:MAG: sodium:alanine symporter family protein [Clostridia bacterium]|nr:sodium:alanine symporter family protein [Clostridia bacterium]
MEFFAYLAELATAILPLALLAVGVYFGLLLRFFPFLHPGRVLHGLKKGGTASFKATFMALAGTVGVGNIAGVALAISAGGAGAVLWMWLCAFAAMLLKYAEITLSMAHRPADGGGGTPQVMRAVGLPRLGSLFALLCLAYTLLVGGAVQASAVAECLSDCFSLSPFLSGLVLVGLTLPVILGGGRRISALTAKLVPLMCAAYIAATVAVIVANRAALPGAMAEIMRGAFSPTAAAGGGLGFLSSRALRVGAARGLMSNEGGCGTAPMAHVTSMEKSPARQGLFGIVEVFADTTVICTLTALALLTACPTVGANGLALVRLAFSTVFGQTTGMLLSLLLFFFAYATVLCQAFYGQVCMDSLPRARVASPLFFVAFCAALLLGAIGTPALVWQACDILLAIMTLCNLFLLIKERKAILLLTREEGLLS